MAEQAELETDVVDGSGRELTPVAPSPAAPMIFGTDDPQKALTLASNIATELQKFVDNEGLAKDIRGNRHLEVGAWQFIGGLLTITPVPGEPARQILEDPNDNTYDIGYVCTTELHDRSGRVVCKGTSRCFRSEERWEEAEEFEIASMAETRSIGKAFRNGFGFIAKMGGYEPTPAEEMRGGQTAAPSSPGRQGSGTRQKRSGGKATTPKQRTAPRAQSTGKDNGRSGRSSDTTAINQNQVKLVFARYHGADAPDEPEVGGAPATLRAIVQWVTGQPEVTEIKGNRKLDEVLEAIADWEGTTSLIRSAAEDAESPDGAEARAIVDEYLGDE